MPAARARLLLYMRHLFNRYCRAQFKLQNFLGRPEPLFAKRELQRAQFVYQITLFLIFSHLVLARQLLC